MTQAWYSKLRDLAQAVLFGRLRGVLTRANGPSLTRRASGENEESPSLARRASVRGFAALTRRASLRKRYLTRWSQVCEPLESRMLLSSAPVAAEVVTATPPAIAVTFDLSAGRLSITGDSSDTTVRESIDSQGYVVLTFGDTTASANPRSAAYDSYLTGATKDTLHSIVMAGGGGHDTLILGDQSLGGGLTVTSDGVLIVDGAVSVQGGFDAAATTITVSGSVTSPGGDVHLVSSDTTWIQGTLDVSGSADGQVGGTIYVLGHSIGVLGTAILDASGDAGGGTILIGGDFQGRNPEILDAEETFVVSGARIDVDAIASGNGGKVVVWANRTTGYYGSITGRGGALGGDGGLIEVSGKENLTFRGDVDVTAWHGMLGTLLLDPTNLIIANGAGDSAADGNATFKGTPSGTVGQILAADTGPTTIFESELEGLGATTNIILQATNNITINNLTDNLLNLTATTGSLTIRADSDGDGAGNFSMDSSDTIRTQGGAVNIRGASLTTVGPINTTGSAGNAGGAVTLQADNGIVNVVGAITTTGGSNANGGAVTITASGAATVSGTITASGGAYSSGNPGRNAGAVSITGGTVSVAAITAVGTTVTAGSNNGGAGGSVVLDATAGGITLGGSITTTGGNGRSSGVGGNAGNITVSDAASLTAAVTLSAVGGTGTPNGSSGNIQMLGTVEGDAAGTRALTLTAGTGNITVSGAAGATNSLLSLTATGNVITTSSINTTGTTNTAGGAVSLTATGALATGGITTLGGARSGAGAGLAGGAGTLSGGTIVVSGAINSSGTTAVTSGIGGNAGVISLNATSGTPAISLGGNITAQGGTGIGAAGRVGERWGGEGGE